MSGGPFTVTAGEAGRRLDQYLTTHLEKLSRVRVQALIQEGKVRVNGQPATRASLHVHLGDVVEAAWAPSAPLTAQPEDIPLEILYEDADLVVVNKPSGMAVHAGGGVHRGTLVNALLFHFTALSRVGGAQRPGLVHRLDRLTSGVIVAAKNDVAHRRLAKQFHDRQVEKTYVALVQGLMKKTSGEIDAPIGRDLVRRTRMTARRAEGLPGVRSALTRWRVLERFPGRLPFGGDASLLEVNIATGRMHQIRVHLASIGHPVVGDTMYGARGGVLDRNFLHARRIRFRQPATGVPVEVEAPLPADLEAFLRGIGHRATETQRRA
jgi:23S rRNA pseudouridine1911/1915/1917 synthase